MVAMRKFIIQKFLVVPTHTEFVHTQRTHTHTHTQLNSFGVHVFIIHLPLDTLALVSHRVING